ncbi:hypothetical protein DPMN_129179 [Dreissena polymorpha]|uniref:Uncharacterized protein n=1 Tax=Dreissena polymorpha TaxID=45954 RepID=A0A9D4H5A2_DREPO|nr:hypothetical protein DPMN_129179 [Dreissena polymorpha]
MTEERDQLTAVLRENNAELKAMECALTGMSLPIMYLSLSHVYALVLKVFVTQGVCHSHRFMSISSGVHSSH